MPSPAPLLTPPSSSVPSVGPIPHSSRILEASHGLTLSFCSLHFYFQVSHAPPVFNTTSSSDPPLPICHNRRGPGSRVTPCNPPNLPCPCFQSPSATASQSHPANRGLSGGELLDLLAGICLARERLGRGRYSGMCRKDVSFLGIFVF